MSHGDVYTSLECLAGVLAALYQRERTGDGQWVEVSMAETMLSVNEHAQWELRPDDSDDRGRPIGWGWCATGSRLRGGRPKTGA